MKKIQLLRLLLISVTLSTFAASEPGTSAALAPSATPPNIVFFLVDDMGWQDTSVSFLYDDDGEPVITPLNQRYRTLPSLLQAAGYRTIHAGKAHFGASDYNRDPLNVGFDVNIAGSEIGHPGSYTGDYGQNSDRPVSGMEAYHHTGIHLTDATTIEVNKAIGRAGKAR